MSDNARMESPPPRPLPPPTPHLYPPMKKRSVQAEPYMTLLPDVDQSQYSKALTWLHRPVAYLRQSIIEIELRQSMLVQHRSADLPIIEPGRAAAAVAPHLARLPYERSLALLLDDACSLLGLAVIGQGDATRSPTDLRVLTALVACHPVAGVVLAHNHPYDGKPDIDPVPSEDDRRCIRAAATVLDVLGVTVLDAIILPSVWTTTGPPFWSASSKEPALLQPVKP